MVGRHENADICIRNTTLSRRHLHFEVTDARSTVQDLGSKNGTQVNGVPIDGPHILADRDEIQLGDAVIIFFESDDHSVLDMMQTSALEPVSPPRVSLRGAAEQWAEGAQDARLGILLQISQTLAEPALAEDAFARVLRLCGEIFDADNLALLVIEGQELRPVAVHRAGGGNEGRAWSEQIARVAQRTRQAVRFDDAATDARLDKFSSVARLGVRCALAAPLLYGNEVIGVVYVDHTRATHPFSDSELDLLAAFANQAAVALHNERLRSELEQQSALQKMLMRYVSPQVAERLVAMPTADLAPVELEVTVLFSDIVGFTARSAEKAPREIIGLLNRYFALMTRVVTKAEGMLEKYIGDALMAVWGAPFPQPDNADRALNAALTMHRVLAELNDELTREGEAPIQVTMGIHSGRVAFGNLGSDEYVQFATIGDTTNVASRVCTVAKPNEIILTEDAHRRLSAAQPTSFEPLGPTRVKGKLEPLNLFRVDGRAGQ